MADGNVYIIISLSLLLAQVIIIIIMFICQRKNTTEALYTVRRDKSY